MYTVDQQVEAFEEILSKDSLNVQIGGTEILQVINKDPLVGNGMGAGFDKVELREGSDCRDAAPATMASS